MKGKVNNIIKAGYIYSILPGDIKSFVLERLGQLEIGKLNGALKRGEDLSLQNKTIILKEFINILKSKRLEISNKYDKSMAAGLFIVSVLVVGSFIYSQIVVKTTDSTIRFINSILNNGGFHLIIFPYMWTAVKNEYNESVIKILFSSSNPIFDMFLSLVTALIISLLYIEPHYTSFGENQALKYFTIFSAVLTGPAVEEIFFRYFLFLKSGRKFGFFLCGLTSAVLFSAVHLPSSFWVFLKYCISGGIFCFLCYFRKSMFPAFLSHSFSNLLILFF